MLKKIFIFYLYLIFSLVNLVNADNWTPIDRVLYKGTTDIPFTVGWSSVDGKYLVMVHFSSDSFSSSNVEYSVFDGDELKFTKVIDQTMNLDKERWVYLGYCSTQSNSIKVVVNGIDGFQVNVDAVKVCKNICDPEPFIIDNEDDGAICTGNFNLIDDLCAYGETSFCLLDSNSSCTWKFDNLPKNLLRIDYEFYLYDTIKKMKVCKGKTAKCHVSITLPHTGFYIVYVRSHLAVSANEVKVWSTWSKEELLSLISWRKFRDVRSYVKNHPNISRTDLYNMIIETGETSEWVNSTMKAFSLVNCKPRAWWVYGHVAAPGPIVIK